MTMEAKPSEQNERNAINNLISAVETLSTAAKIQTRLILQLNERITKLETKTHEHWWKP